MRTTLRITLVCLFSFFVFSCQNKSITQQEIGIIPLPQTIVPQEGAFRLNTETEIFYASEDKDLIRTANFLNDYIELAMGYRLKVKLWDNKSTGIILKTGFNHTNEEAYSLTIDDKKILIDGVKAQGVFWAIQSLRQIMPASSTSTTIHLPALLIEDHPRFSYRGMHLDVGRHMYDLPSIKKFIDLLAFHKIKTFHWHLTEDQGWRLEIKKYPKLTEISAFRKGTVIGNAGNSDELDGVPYGGFYTQEEAKEIVRYAAERFITVIPEIELPGHSVALLAAYPELGCTGGPYEVRTTFGVSDDVFCAGNENVFSFLEDVFDEVIAIFPSEYIHIGGDECPKKRWKECKKCQSRIKKEKLKDEHELQSYFIQRIEKYLNSRGRRIIGWDEILEGGIAPQATIMSWRGFKGGIEAAKQHHDVIMTPTSHCYFNYYQTISREGEELCMGGSIPVEKVYQFDPIPSELPQEYHKYILGGQANLWTEYIKTYSQVEHMVCPRIAALSEAIWSPAKQKDWTDFKKRLLQLFSYYDVLNINYARYILAPKIDLLPGEKEGGIIFEIANPDPQTKYYYTLDGSTPTESSQTYSSSITIDKTATIRVKGFMQGRETPVASRKVIISKSTLKKCTSINEPESRFKHLVDKVLTDGLRGNMSFNDGNWVGYAGENAELLLDLGNTSDISLVKVGSLVHKPSWILGPVGMEVFVSNDGENFNSVGKKKINATQNTDNNGIFDHELKFENTKARFVKLVIYSPKTLPEWHPGAGGKAYVFIDEIQIY